MMALTFAVLVSPAWTDGERVGDLSIEQPWARATIGQGAAGAAYLTVVNHGAAADRLLAVTTPAAKKAELHTHSMDGGVMKMRHVEAVDIAPQATTVLAPGGYHIMLFGLAKPLSEGDAFPVTLRFQSAGSVEVQVRVRAAGAM